MMLIDSQVLATIYFFTALGAENGLKVFNFNQVNHKRHGSFFSFFSGGDGKVHLSFVSQFSLSLLACSAKIHSELLINVFDVKPGKSFLRV